MNKPGRIAVVLALALATLPTAARADGSEAGQSPGFREDMATRAPDEDYGAFIHFGAGTRPEHDDLLRRSGLGAGMWFPSVDTVYAWGKVRDFAALVGNPLVTYLEDLQAFEPAGETAVWSTRARVAQTRALGGPYRDAAGRVLDGSGIGIAVVDTGVDGTHPDLAGRMRGNFKIVCSTPVLQNTTTNECFGPVVYQQVPDSDSAGHGTHVAGIVAGDGTASAGTFKGVAPGANLYGFSWFEGASVGNLQSAAAFRWVLDNGPTANPPVKIVTNSWGCVGGCAYDPASIVNRLANQLVDAGVTLLWAAGNDGGTGASNVLSGYAKNPKPGVIGVAGSFDSDTGARDGTMYDDSSRARDHASDAANFPDISAPGQFIVSTCTHRKPDCEVGAWIEWSEHYSNLTGTSMATPHVAGAAALLYQAKPGITPATVEDVLLDTARKISGSPLAPGAYLPDPQNPGSTTSFDKGAGLLDVPAALSDPRVAAAADGVGRNADPALAITSPTAEASVANPVTIAGTAADGTYDLASPVTIATDPDDYDGAGAGELRALSLADTTGALTVRIRVHDVDDRIPNGLIRYILAYKIDGTQKRTSIDLRTTGATIPPQDTANNTHPASTVSLDAATDAVTFTVSHATLGNPSPNALIHNIQSFVQAGVGAIVIQDTMPGGIADNLARPRYAEPFTLRGVPDPVRAASVRVSIDGGPPVAASVAGTGPYTWSAALAPLPVGTHTATATLLLAGVPRATATRTFEVVENSAPVLAPIGALSVDEMSTLTVDVSATDADHPASSLTLGTSPLPSGATFTPTGAGTARLTWRPTSAQSGSYPITFTVTDPASATDSEVVTIVVRDAVPRAVHLGLEYASIQAAIAAAAPDDTVFVLPGTHDVALTIDRRLTLCGSPDGLSCIQDRNAAAGVTLRASGSAPVVRIQAPSAIVQGLTFDAFEVAVRVEAPSASLRHSRFRQGSRGIEVGAADGTIAWMNTCSLSTTVCAAFAQGVAGRTLDARLNDWSVYVDALVRQRMAPGASTILFRPYLMS